MKKSTKKYLLYGAGAYVLLTSGVLAGSSVQGMVYKAQRDWLIKEVQWQWKAKQELQDIARARGVSFDEWLDNYDRSHPGSLPAPPGLEQLLVREAGF